MLFKRAAYVGILSGLFTTMSNAQGNVMDEVEILRADFLQSGAMDFDGGPGDYTFSRFDTQFVLSKPIEIFGGIRMVPLASYAFTRLDLEDTGVIPIHDEDLHSISVSSMFFKNFEGTQWMAVGWTRAEMATDFQDISGDDFTFDVALGAAYQLTDDLNIGFGIVALNLNNDEMFFPGINFVWTPCENSRVTLFGPNLIARYNFNENWHMTLSGEPGGGVWNIRDDAGLSRSIEMDSYLLGLNTNHRLTGNLWFVAGVGYSFANELELRDNDGEFASFSRDADGAAFVRVGLSLRTW